MSYGFESRNSSSNFIQIDALYKTHSFVSKHTPSSKNDNQYLYNISGGRTDDLFALRGPTSVVYEVKAISGGVQVTVLSNSTNTNAHVIYRFRGASVTPPNGVDDYGLEIFTGASDLVYTSKARPLTVLGAYSRVDNNVRQNTVWPTHSATPSPGRQIAAITSLPAVVAGPSDGSGNIQAVRATLINISGSTYTISFPEVFRIPVIGSDVFGHHSGPQSFSAIFVDVTNL